MLFSSCTLLTDTSGVFDLPVGILNFLCLGEILFHNLEQLIFQFHFSTYICLGWIIIRTMIILVQAFNICTKSFLVFPTTLADSSVLPISTSSGLEDKLLTGTSPSTGQTEVPVMFDDLFNWCQFYRRIQRTSFSLGQN